MKNRKYMYSIANIINKKPETTIYVRFCFSAIVEIYKMKNEEHNEVLVKLGLTIRKIREESTSFSQDKLGLEVELSENQIRRIEKGQTNPTVKSLLKIARALNVNVRDFFEFEIK